MNGGLGGDLGGGFGCDSFIDLINLIGGDLCFGNLGGDWW